MSHRPLDMLKRDNRAADRVPHLRRRNVPVTDTIDSLDRCAVGGLYHHGGPYDATLASRNTNKVYSPVEAVKESNHEALRATPSDYIQDSITKRVPLQGTAIVPPGKPDMKGHVMNYTEGSDVMRDADAPGGPYRRWDFVVSQLGALSPRSATCGFVLTHLALQTYHPDDLKGKGEPSYTIERDEKERRRVRKQRPSSACDGAVNDYEMMIMMEQRRQSQSRSNSTLLRKPVASRVMVRQRSVSSAAAQEPSPPPYAPMNPASPVSPRPAQRFFEPAIATTGDLHRRNTTGNRFTEGLRRRLGSLRRKKSNAVAAA